MTQHNQHDPDHRQDNTDLQHLPLSDLALFCAHALQVLTEGNAPDDLYPLELFRRAVVLRDSAAWECIYRQYAPFVLPYLLRHPQVEALLLQKEPTALVDAVLSTFAANLTEEKLAHLNSLALLLKYLRVCVHTTVADATRGQQWLARLEAETAPGAPTLGHAGDPQAGTQGLWQVLVGELPGEDERVLFTLLFVRGLSAQAVCSQEPRRFPDKEAVYRGKALIFERLRTSEHLQAIFGPPFKGMSPDQ